MLTTEARDLDEDEGFTLIEVVMTVTIGLLIVGAVTAAIITSLRLMEQSSSQLGDAGNSRYSSAYFSTDVQEASTFGTKPPTECGTGDLLIQFRGSDFDVDKQPKTSLISYTLETVSAPNIADTYQLHRQSCTFADDPPPTFPVTPALDTILASNLSTTTPPKLQCFRHQNPADTFTTDNPYFERLEVDCNEPSAWFLTITLTPESPVGSPVQSSAAPFQLIGTRRST